MTIQEVREEIGSLLLRLAKLEILPSELRTLQAEGDSRLRALRASAMAEQQTEFGMQIIEAVIALVEDLHKLMKGAGLDGTADLDAWRADLSGLREHVNQTVARGRALLARARGRDLSKEAKRSMVELERNTLRLEAAGRFLEDTEPYLKTLEGLRDGIHGQIADLMSIPGAQRAIDQLRAAFDRVERRKAARAGRRTASLAHKVRAALGKRKES